MKQILGLAIVGLMAVPAAAQITVDGTKDAGYGAALAVQTVQTQFGDSTGGLTGGGELDAGYATISGGRLYLMLTGNVEPNFNKVSVFIDSQPGGENVLNGALSYDGGVSQNFGGLTFDAGFTADYHIFGRWGGFTGNTFEVDVVNRAASTPGNIKGDFGSASVGAGTAVQSGSVLGNGNGTTSFLTSPAQFGFNNTNSAGVSGGTLPANQAAAAAVNTGVELSIALADIGNPGPATLIKIHAVYGNGDNNFHSNQVLGGLPTGMANGVPAGETGNLGGNGTGGFTGTLSGVNFANYAGDQFFTIRGVPEPASAAMAGLALAALAAARRRRAV